MEKIVNKPRCLELSLTNGEQQVIEGNRVRMSLQANWKGYSNASDLYKKVLAIGINPSTATTGESDMTMTKLCRFLDLYGYDNVKMINLYSYVTPNQDKLKEIPTDFDAECKNFEETDIILLVWGWMDMKIENRKHFRYY